MQQGFNLTFVLCMQRGQHGAEPERAGGQQQILDGGIDRRAPRDPPQPGTRVAVVDTREDEHGHAGHLLREFRAMPVWLGERLHVCGRRLPRRQVPLTKPTFDLGIPDHDKAPRLPVAPIGRADGGVQHGLNRLVGHGLFAEVAYRSLAVDGIEKRHVFLCHGGTLHPNLLPHKA